MGMDFYILHKEFDKIFELIIDEYAVIYICIV